MAVKRIGISRDLIIHPGETISDVLEERSISQVELAVSTGVSPAYVSNVIAGKKDISARFALALEYALDIPKSFWINLQANYDAELVQANEYQTITDEERKAFEELSDVVKFLRKKRKLLSREKADDAILSLRKALRISNVTNLKDIVSVNASRMANISNIKPYVLGAWIRLCQIAGETSNNKNEFSLDRIDLLVGELKKLMLKKNNDIQDELQSVFARYGIDFSIVPNFKGAPVLGYIALKNDGTYQMAVTISKPYADIFWLSIFHELGHIVNGDINKKSIFVDAGTDVIKEYAADKFAHNKLLSEMDYQVFIDGKNYEIECIKSFAAQQKVMPYIVIRRLQQEKLIDSRMFDDYKLRYEWV